MHLLFGIVMITLLYAGPVNGVSEQVETQPLYDYLFTDYTSNLLPKCRSSSTVTLKMDIAMRQIIDLNEPEQILTTNVWMRLSWTDCRLTWIPADFDNLTYVTVMYDDVWVPDITLYDSAAAEDSMFPGREEYRAYISSSGSISYNFPTIMISICRVNVKYFPFDTQTCTLKFGSWSHHGLELDIVSKNPKGDTDVFVTNNEWIVEDFPAVRHELFYNCCPEPYPDVTYYVILRRRPAFYVMTMLFPCVLVTFVAGLTFLLPTESGEKVSLEITVLLSLSVFLLLVSEALPPSSDNFPIIGVYFAASMVLVTLSLLQTIIVVNLFHRGRNGRQVPRWVRVLFFKFLGKLLCAKRQVTSEKSSRYEQKKNARDLNDVNIKMPPNNSSSLDLKQNGTTDFKTVIRTNGIINHTGNQDTHKTVETLGEQLRVLRSIEDMSRENLDLLDETIISEWKDVSNITDRLFLVIYSLVSIVTTLIFVVQMIS